MSWPLLLDVPGCRVQVPGPGAWALPSPVDDAVIDALLAASRLRLGAIGVGWVPAGGGLVANLPVWQNVLLATQWHAPASMAALEARVRGWCDRLTPDSDETARLLLSMPARLDDEERCVAGWLRQLLARPKLILLEARALPGGVTGARVRALLAEELPAAALVAVDRCPPGFEPLIVDGEVAP